jgi:hypothetical protein
MPDQPDLDSRPLWVTSSRCDTGNCVEVAYLSPNTIGLRDNKDPNSPILKFSAADWSTFLAGIHEQA